MFIIRMHPARRFSSSTIAFAFATALVSQAMAADSGSAIPDMSGQWGRDMLFFEPPPSGPGPIVNSVRKSGCETAKTHVSRTMRKLGAHDRAQLVVLAYETGLVSPPASVRG